MVCVRRTLLTMTLMCIMIVQLCAQTPIGGIVNSYARVTAVQTVDCRSYVTIDTVDGFGAGDRILLVQMKGSVVSGSYATQTVGLTEYAVIDTIIGTTITTVHPLIHVYDVAGAVQCVRVPEYDEAVATMNVMGKPWDGRTGGVIAFDVRTTLTLQADVVADGIGFRGGRIWNGSVGCSTKIADGAVNSPSAGMKGETYVDALPTQISGLAPLFTGGGGGCDHNAGGGGGGNGGVGGIGGAQYEGCGRYFDNGGRGGLSVQPVINGFPRLLLGGGGGAGHTNNSIGTGGGNGGGIVIIRCPSIIGMARRISASGTTAPDAGNDGAGGGGAGGTIYLATTQIQRGLTAIAGGGAGGNVRTGAIHGNGAGGAGGVFLYEGPGVGGGLSYALPGGACGLNLQRTVEAERINLATRGNDGQVSLNVVIPENVGQIPNIQMTAPADTIVCPGTPLSLRARAQGAYARVQWVRDDGRIVSTTLEYGFVASETRRYVIRLIDERGCVSDDTCTVVVDRQWDLAFPAVNRTAPGCSEKIEDALWLTNNSKKPATVRAVRSRSQSVTITVALPVEIGPGEKMRIPVAIILPTTLTTLTFDVEADITPCDTTVETSFTITRGGASFGVTPTSLTLDPVLACVSVEYDTVVHLRFPPGGLVITEVIAEGDVRSLMSVPFTPSDTTSTPITIRWRPTFPRGAGRLGFVGRIDACVDTMWVDLDGLVTHPRITVVEPPPPATFVLCRDTTFSVEASILSSDSTVWTVDSVTVSGPGTCNLVSGQQLQNPQTLTCYVTPTSVGPYEVIIRARLLPCDTVLTWIVRGVATDVGLSGTDKLVFTEAVIGREQVLQATYRNTGDAPLRVVSIVQPALPFRIVSVDPSLPATVQPGEDLRVLVGIRQRVGAFIDSLTLIVDDPCSRSYTTILSSTATTQTHVMMPDVRGQVDVVTTMPVILSTRPSLDSSMATDFTLQLRCSATECDVVDGLDSLTQWTVSRSGDQLVIDVSGRWDRGDTLARVPMRPLLSRVDSVAVVFDRTQGLVWQAFDAPITYDDGSIVIDDVCATRRLRMVTLDARPRVSVRPQPARDHIVIALSDDTQHHLDVTAVDILGHAVTVTSALVRGTHRVSLSDLASGWYALTISVDGISSVHVLAIVRDR